MKKKYYSLKKIKEMYPHFYANAYQVKQALIELGYLKQDGTFKEDTKFKGVEVKQFTRVDSGDVVEYFVFREDVVKVLVDYFEQKQTGLSLSKICEKYPYLSRTAILDLLQDHGMIDGYQRPTEKGKQEYQLSTENFENKDGRLITYLAFGTEGIKKILNERKNIINRYSEKTMQGHLVENYKKIGDGDIACLPGEGEKEDILFCYPAFLYNDGQPNQLKEVCVLNPDGKVMYYSSFLNLNKAQKKEELDKLSVLLNNKEVFGEGLRKLELSMWTKNRFYPHSFSDICEKFIFSPKGKSPKNYYQLIFNEEINPKSSYDQALTMLKVINAIENGPYLPLSKEQFKEPAPEPTAQNTQTNESDSRFEDAQEDSRLSKVARATLELMKEHGLLPQTKKGYKALLDKLNDLSNSLYGNNSFSSNSCEKEKVFIKDPKK